MDFSGFWAALVIQTLVYGYVWLQATPRNIRAAQKLFIGVSLPIGLCLLYIFFTLDPSKQNYPMPPFVVHAIGLVAPIALVFFLFRQSIERYTQEAQKEETELARYAALSSTERAAEQAQAEKLRHEKVERQAEISYGKIVLKLKCPHCGEKGYVRRKQETRVDKSRVNSIAGRAVGMGTNTERHVTQMRCDACETQWDV